MTLRIPLNLENPASEQNANPALDRGLEITLKRFIRGSTYDILSRPAFPIEIHSWIGQLTTGMSRQTMLEILLSSTEKRQMVVRSLHERVFKRPPTDGQIRFWSDRLASGTTLDEIAAEMLTSPEYQAALASGGEDYVRALFRDILQRRPAEGELTAWAGLLDGCVASRREIALDFLSSQEYRSQNVRKWFQLFLRREPAPRELEGILEKLRQGYSNETLLAEILGGQEYFEGKVRF